MNIYFDNQYQCLCEFSLSSKTEPTTSGENKNKSQTVLETFFSYNKKLNRSKSVDNETESVLTEDVSKMYTRFENNTATGKLVICLIHNYMLYCQKRSLFKRDDPKFTKLKCFIDMNINPQQHYDVRTFIDFTGGKSIDDFEFNNYKIVLPLFKTHYVKNEYDFKYNVELLCQKEFVLFLNKHDILSEVLDCKLKSINKAERDIYREYSKGTFLKSKS